MPSLTSLANPGRFMAFAGLALPWLAALACVSLAAGLWFAFTAPADYQQGETVRIMYLHVPSAWLALLIYSIMSVSAVGALVWRHPLAEVSMKAAAPLGCAFTFLCLVTGSLWGKPMWGTWWVWDARLTSELILFFLYIGFIALQAAIDDPRRADKAGAIIALVGVVNIPIIYFSVRWWNTLHQGASVSMTKSASVAQTMLWAMLIMALAFWMYSIAVALARVRNIILERESQTEWVQHAMA
jgi:heme exporter protein C